MCSQFEPCTKTERVQRVPLEALLPGGSLSPIRRATNPLMATLGGVVGPVAAYAQCLANGLPMVCQWFANAQKICVFFSVFLFVDFCS